MKNKDTIIDEKIGIILVNSLTRDEWKSLMDEGVTFAIHDSFIYKISVDKNDVEKYRFDRNEKSFRELLSKIHFGRKNIGDAEIAIKTNRKRISKESK